MGGGGGSNDDGGREGGGKKISLAEKNAISPFFEASENKNIAATIRID